MSVSPPSKRRRTTQQKLISPPPIRRKFNHDHVATVALHTSARPSSRPVRPTETTQLSENQTQSRFEVISWNVNGISHLLQPSYHDITSFFARKAAAPPRNALDAATDSESQSEIEASPIAASSKDGVKIGRSPSRSKNIHKGARKCSPIRAFLQQHNFPQIVCLQEVKISPSDEVLKARFERAVNSSTSHSRNQADFEPRYDISYSLPRDRFNARGPGGKGKVYGVCTLVRTDLLNPPSTSTSTNHEDYSSNKQATSTLSHNNTQNEPHRKPGPQNTTSTHSAPWDLEGRVLTTTIPHLNLAILNGYWVNGTANPWRDSSTGTIIGTRHDAKRAFHSLMLLEAKTHEAAGRDILLVGDMNVARDERDGYPGIRLGADHVANRADFNGKFFAGREGGREGGGGGGAEGQDGAAIATATSMDGVDTYRYIHGDRRGYTYHGEKAEEWGRSCDRVDLGIASRGLVESGVLVGADIWESVEERAGSDHVPIGVVLDFGCLERKLR